MQGRHGIPTVITVLVICCAVVFMGSCSRSGKRGPGGPPGGPGGSFLSTMFDTRPFNPGVDKLPPMYAGHNPELLYNTIQMRKERVARDPQETQEKYKARVGQEIYLPLMGAMDFDSLYAFRVSPKEVIYSTREQVMRVRCQLTAAFEGGREEKTKKAFMVRYLPQLDNRYTVTGSGGSKTEVEEIKFSEYAVVAVNAWGRSIETSAVVNAKEDAKTEGITPQVKDSPSNHETITATIKMTPEDARRFEGAMMALLVGRLVEPYTSYEEIRRQPTSERRGTYLARYHYLYIQLLEIWFYDAIGGKVVKKIGNR